MTEYQRFTRGEGLEGCRDASLKSAILDAAEHRMLTDPEIEFLLPEGWSLTHISISPQRGGYVRHFLRLGEEPEAVSFILTADQMAMTPPPYKQKLVEALDLVMAVNACPPGTYEPA